jgi:shikimate kinase
VTNVIFSNLEVLHTRKLYKLCFSKYEKNAGRRRFYHRSLDTFVRGQMILIVFGLAASGKTYIGRLISKHFGYHHEDADAWLTDAMKQSIADGTLFTFEMLDEYTEKIIANIEELHKDHSHIVISQALYRTKNREVIKNYFTNHPEGKREIIFLQVDAGDETIYKRVADRGDWVSPEYAKENRVWFQPMEDAISIRNEGHGDDHLIEQLLQLEVLQKAK